MHTILKSLRSKYKDNLKYDYGLSHKVYALNMVSEPENIIDEVFLILDKDDCDPIYLIYANNKFGLFALSKRNYLLYSIPRDAAEKLYVNIAKECPSFFYVLNENFII